MSKLVRFAAACAAVVCAFAARADVDITFDQAVTDYTPVIRAAVESTDPGGVITLSEGVYPLASTLAVDRAITLRGAASGGTILKASATGYYVLGVSNDATIERLAITGGSQPNGWQFYGIGVNISAGTLSQCVITNNSYTAAGNACGVGVYASVANNKTVTITHCRICDNVAKVSNNLLPGAGLYVAGGGKFRMDNCLIARNTSTGPKEKTNGAGAGLCIVHADAVIANCTIVDNVHTYRGGGVSIEGGKPKFINCIIAKNTANNDASVHAPDVSSRDRLMADGTIDAQYLNAGTTNNLVSMGVTPFGGGGIAADPVFGKGTYELMFGSPAIGYGVAVEGVTDGVDLNGVARSPESIDLGCFAYVPSEEMDVFVALDATTAYNDQPVGVAITHVNPPAGKELEDRVFIVNGDESYPIEVTDGVAVIERPGVWTVKVEVYADDEKLAESESGTSVHVGVRTAYVTANEQATPAFPYVTPETAATSFDDVIGLCIAGSVIELDEGVHPVAATLSVDNAITMRGAENGGTVLKATGTGYCVLNVTGGATIERLAITGGSRPSGWGGDGVGVSISAGTLSQCVITNNSYTGAGNAYGVGVYANVGASRTVRITRCRICGNSAASSNNTMPGVGLYVGGGGTFRMDNCLVAGNTSTKGNDSSTWAGGGMFISHSDAQIVNCTFADNHHNNRGGGVNVGGGTPKFYNCIIARNAVDTRDPCIYKPDVSATTLTADGDISSTIANGFHNTLVSFGVPAFGADGLAGDPLFKADGYQLKNGSPAIGKGVPVEGVTDGVDLDGTARDPESVDLGCYTYVPTIEFSVQVEVGATTAFNDDPVPVTVTYFNVPEGKTLVDHYYAVSATETNALECVDGKVVIARPGTWNVRVVVTDGENVLASEDSPTTVKVGVHKVFVTSRADATPEFPYVTPETAAACLNDVTEYCIDGTEIELDAGTHTISGRNDFTAAVHLHGVGRDLTWINGNGGVIKNGAFYVNNSGFVMENLSVTNFYRANGGAVELSVEGGTVRNCRFAKNELHWAGGNCNGMVILSSGAKTLIENCVFEDLSYTAEDNGCSGIAICLNGGTARNCLFANICTDGTRGTETSIVSVGSGATLENCTFADCSVKYYKNGDNAVNTVYLISTAGTVRNVLCCALEKVHAESEPVPPWAYLRGTAASAVRNCCFEGEAKYGIDGADGTKINFKVNEPYHLRVISSCRNAGLGQEWMSGATDLDGRPRVFGKKVDIGCYECQEGPGLMLLVR